MVTTFGVEEEFHVVSGVTGELVPAAYRLLGDADAEPELQRSVIETATDVHTSLTELRADLVAKRRSLRLAAEPHGLAVVAAGTTPFSGTGTPRVFPNARYEWMAQEYRQLVDEQQVCACQVQVGVDDRDLAVRVTRRVRAWLPTLLALSVSSPMFAGADTGYGSYRTVVTSRWPTVGPPPDLDSAAEYDLVVGTLVDSGVISDAGMIYFDARPSARYPTVEIRVADACPDVDTAVLLAALARALVVTACAEDAGGAPPPSEPQVLLRAATWRAARSGLDGHLVDPLTRRALPATDQVRALLAHVADALDEAGDRQTAEELLAALWSRGTSATRQQAAAQDGLSTRDQVLNLATQTAGQV